MTDLFSNEQGKRLFGFISVGGSLGAIIGGSITASLVKPIGAANLLLVSGAMFEVAAQSVRFFPADFARGQQASQERREEEAAIGGSLWSGITHIFRSPYLFGLFAFIIFYSTTSTWAYFQQSDLAGHGFADRAARTTFFANLDRSVNTLTLLGQLFLTGRLLKWFGVTPTLDLDAGAKFDWICFHRSQPAARGVGGVSSAAARGDVCVHATRARGAVHGAAA